MAPVAAITATPTSGSAPLLVTFDGRGSSDLICQRLTYSWNFADGSPTVTTPVATHTYSAPGTYSASLMVTDSGGATDFTTVTITVRGVANARPVANATATPSSGASPLTVGFSSAGSTDANGTITGYSWDFGDGSAPSTAANPTYTYSTPGKRTVKLTVTDNVGDSSSATTVVTVGTNTPPSASTFGTATAAKANGNSLFDATQSADPGGRIAKFSWDFGDGRERCGARSGTHVFTAPGTYQVILTVTDDFGDTATATVPVVVTTNIAPTAAIVATPTSGKQELTVQFQGGGSTDPDGTVVFWGWDFGDGTAAGGGQVSHVYTTAGTFTATLTVTDNNGATDTHTVQITVTPNLRPTAVLGASATTGPAPLTVNLTSAGSSDPDGTIASYYWDFGDGSAPESGATASHQYTTPGYYVVTLVVRDNNNATDTRTILITVT
ncbi:MAG TPA: PKD domain-containing protein [Microthrixaceae bacterium]|nr:PKD domain-containing protein [Microthrixaceae bacterium]